MPTEWDQPAATPLPLVLASPNPGGRRFRATGRERFTLRPRAGAGAP